MPRKSDSRRKIVEYLSRQGPVKDSSGRATAVLKEAIGYDREQTAFIQLVSAMANAGEIERDVRGKRTYELRIPGNAQKELTSLENGGALFESRNLPLTTQFAEIDYDELAAVLLARVTRLFLDSEQGSDAGGWARRRIERLETRSANAERDLARARAALKNASEERDTLKAQLDAAQHNLDLLAERSGPRRDLVTRASRHLGSEDRALLHRLTGEGKCASSA